MITPEDTAYPPMPTNANPAVTMLMPVYNGQATLREAVESVLAQSYVNFEFLIINDASTDATASILKEYALKDLRIKLIHNERNLRLAATLNKGLSLASAPLIARMDADDVSLPDRLERQVGFMNEHPEVTVCGGFAIEYDTNRVWDHLPQRDAALRVTMLRTCPLAHPTCIYKKYAVIAAGGYPEDYPYCEDYALWAELAADPRTVFATLPNIVLRYRVHPISERPTYYAEQSRQAGLVRASLVRRLIPDASETELACHEILCGDESKVSPLMLARCREWINRLLAANGASGIYDRELFREFWLQRWWKICRGSIHAGTMWGIITGYGLQGTPRFGLLRSMILVFRYWLQRKLLPRKLRSRIFEHAEP